MLMRFDPFREFDELLRPWSGGPRLAAMPMDAYRRGEEFVVEMDLPGIDPSSIDLTVERNVLQVTAQRHGSFGQDDQVIVSERPTGQMTRQLFLGEGLDTDRISADYADGVLVVTLPVAEEAKPHKISVGAGDTQKAVTAESRETAAA